MPGKVYRHKTNWQKGRFMHFIDAEKMLKAG